MTKCRALVGWRTLAKSTKNVVIVGGGLIGFSSAYHLIQAGFGVTVIERGEQADPSCSTGNAGMVVPSHFIPLAAPGVISQGLRWMFNPESPFAIRPRPSWELISWAWKFYRASRPARVKRAMPLLRDLALRSRERFEELASTDGFDFGLQKRGLLMLCKSEKGLEHEKHVADEANKIGVAAEILNSDEVKARDPNIDIDVAGAIFFSQDCHLDPAGFLSDLRREVVKGGGDVRWNEEVQDFNTFNGSVSEVVLKSGETIEGDEFVICGGAWSPGLGRKLGVRLPMQAGKGYSVTHPNPPALPSICALLNEARVAVTPIGDKLRVGGTMEIVGLDQSVNKRRLSGILKSLKNYYPQLSEGDFEGLEVWRGLRPCSPDGIPYIGRTKRKDNVVIATGHSMLGLSLAPVTGELVAEIVSGGKPDLDMDLLDPDRY